MTVKMNNTLSRLTAANGCVRFWNVLFHYQIYISRNFSRASETNSLSSKSFAWKFIPFERNEENPEENALKRHHSLERRVNSAIQTRGYVICQIHSSSCAVSLSLPLSLSLSLSLSLLFRCKQIQWLQELRSPGFPHWAHQRLENATK